MKIAYLMILGLVLGFLLVPFYIERHPLTNTLRANMRDCYTNISGQTICTSEDTAAFIGFAGLALVTGCLLLLTSISITYPIARRFGLT